MILKRRTVDKKFTPEFEILEPPFTKPAVKMWWFMTWRLLLTAFILDFFLSFPKIEGFYMIGLIITTVKTGIVVYISLLFTRKMIGLEFERYKLLIAHIDGSIKKGATVNLILDLNSKSSAITRFWWSVQWKLWIIYLPLVVSVNYWLMFINADKITTFAVEMFCFLFTSLITIFLYSKSINRKFGGKTLYLLKGVF